MKARTLMVQGTASNVGKSLLVTALCRIMRQDGIRVAPFKSQNMANNSYITPDGLEIGRAQGVQAEAAGLAATADMNPILLKPSGLRESQVVIHGRPVGTMDFRHYRQDGYDRAATAIQTSLERLRAQYEAVVIEGAGSPAEVNLKDRELVNMRVAAWAEAPVLLVADIDRGGALASLVGTLALLEPHEQARVAGLVINKFRGERSLLQPAVDFLEERTGKPVLGVLPYVPVELEGEDSLAMPSSAARDGEGLRVAALRLPQISNFTDLDPLRREPGVQVEWVTEVAQLQGVDAVVIPGSKVTAADLRWLWQSGLGAAVERLAQRGVPVVGICGGYQMLGQRVLDPGGHESAQTEIPGLGLLDVETEFAPVEAKVTQRTEGALAPGIGGALAGLEGLSITGYEIHMGQTHLGPGAVPWAITPAGGALGASDPDGQVWGTYLHGLFENEGLRRAWLAWLWRRRGLTPPAETAAFDRDQVYDRLAAAVRAGLDMERVYTLMELVRHSN